MSDREPDSRRGLDRLDDVDDAVFAALADRERRAVVYFLHEHGTATVAELADVVTGWVHGARGVATSDDRERVRVALHHVHLPRLAAAGLVTYDADGQRVELATLTAAEEALVAWAADVDADT